MARSLRSIFELAAGSPSSGRVPGSGGGEGPESAVAAIGKITSALQVARAQGIRSYGDLATAAQQWNHVTVKATSELLALLTRHSRLESSSVAAHAKAEQAKSLATVSALKQTAIYKALAATAAGFEALGNFDFWAAAQDFTSAALYGALAGEQIAGAAAGSRGGAAAGTSRYASRSSDESGGYGASGSGVGIGASELAGGAASAKYGPSGNLTVAIMGDNEAGEWLAKTLNTAVEQRGVQLTSTRSTRSAYAQG